MVRKVAWLSVVMVLMYCVPSEADFIDFNGTLVNKDDSGPEATLLTIYNTVYGTSFDWTDLVPLQILSDQVWRVPGGTAKAVALFSGLGQVFGVYTDLGTGNVKTPVLEVPDGTPSFLNDPLAPGGSFPFGGVMGFYRGGTDTGWFSESALNPGVDQGKDHLVAFNAPNYRSYLLFWEDRTFDNNRSDQDYNDFAVKVTPVPEPTSILLLLSGLGSVAYWKKRKR